MGSGGFFLPTDGTQGTEGRLTGHRAEDCLGDLDQPPGSHTRGGGRGSLSSSIDGVKPITQPAALHRRHLSESQRGMIAGAIANLKIGSNQHPSIDGPSITQPAALHRRHLSESQRGMIAATIANMGHGGDRKSDEIKGAIAPLKSNSEAAELMNVSKDTVKRAKRVINNAVPVLQSMVTEGDGFRWNQFIN